MVFTLNPERAEFNFNFEPPRRTPRKRQAVVKLVEQEERVDSTLLYAINASFCEN